MDKAPRWQWQVSRTPGTLHALFQHLYGLKCMTHPYSANGEIEDKKGRGLILDPMSCLVLLLGRGRTITVQESTGLVAQVASCAAACLLPPAPPPASHPPDFHVLEKGEGWSLKSAGNLLGEGLRMGKATRHALGVPMGQPVRFAPKEGSQQVTSDRGRSG